MNTTLVEDRLAPLAVPPRGNLPATGKARRGGLRFWLALALATCVTVLLPARSVASVRLTIVSFTAKPSTIAPGGSTVLSWNVLGADKISINNGIGVVTGSSITVSPTATTTYRLTATRGTTNRTASVKVTVKAGTTTVSISSFTASPPSIAAGGSATLSWNVSNATSLSIDNGVGAVSGTSVTVRPAATTTYTLTAKNATSTRTATATVTVLQPPSITLFAASPATITAGQSTTLSWTVGGATSLSIDQGMGTVTGTSVAVSPAATTTYTLTATNAAGSRTAAATVTVGASGGMRYLTAYENTLQGSWVRSCWENAEGALFTDFAAAAPGRTGTAIEVRFGAANAWNAFGLADRKPGWDPQYKYLNEMRTIEFDIYFEPDSTGTENLQVVLEDAGYSGNPALVSYIPNWASLSSAQRFGKWFHIAIDLAGLNPTIARFHQFLLFNGGTGQPHFRIANVKLGWVDDATPPVVALDSTTLSPAYDRMTLAFHTSEPAIQQVEYGIGNYGTVLAGPSDAWQTQHTAVLPNLQLGATYFYRLVAKDHRTDPLATPNTGTATGTFTVPAAPTAPPVISGLSVGGITGSSATLAYTTNRPCQAVVTYRKSGGADLTRTFTDLAASRSVVLDLLEPSTTYTVGVAVTDAFQLSASASTTFATGATTPRTVTITADPVQERTISPWIYGINFYQGITNAPRNLTLNRQGGNRWTAYNWENNASNAGSDWYYSNDSYLGGGETPAEAVRSLVAADRARGNASLITLQLQGYVSADKNGNVDINDPNRFSTRFKPIAFRKGAAFTATPSTSDAAVYMDEFVWALRQKIGSDIYADSTRPTFVSFDNEPELWPYTHAEIQTGPMPVDTYIQRTVDLAKAVKDVAPAAVVFGPVHYGFNGIVNFQDAPGFSSTYWFTDKYLADLKAASAAVGRRLLDVYDIHWYSEAQANGTRITELTGANLTAAQVQAIVQSPRSLWDKTYREASWIADYFGGPVWILGRLQAKIDATWPGTKLAVTEYANGGDNHIAGAIAQADNLGVFGQTGVFAATYWPLTSSFPFVSAGFRMYRDYDGNLGAFGDLSIPTTSSDTSKVAVYASRDSSRAGRYVLVAINRSTAAQDVGIDGLNIAGTARLYRVSGTSSTPAFVGSSTVSLPTWVVSLPALSVTTIEITP